MIETIHPDRFACGFYNWQPEPDSGCRLETGSSMSPAADKTSPGKRQTGNIRPESATSVWKYHGGSSSSVERSLSIVLLIGNVREVLDSTPRQKNGAAWVIAASKCFCKNPLRFCF
ncbi:hypothetical protein PGTUg99_024802 [Puccinia graminis f. sp. tritici]|uniref:Uncharacterized protein n=1 Tax=Puccinia graminis f. sp. tritici TaxID=56615 RepID=A0A5B0PRJ0_PUCGR|nr:hypothetical protein PGTUg99_024802 [Puccinia graminis f. sp. tritici]